MYKLVSDCPAFSFLEFFNNIARLDDPNWCRNNIGNNFFFRAYFLGDGIEEKVQIRNKAEYIMFADSDLLSFLI